MPDFDKLWKEFNEKLLKYIQTMVPRTQDSEDILQEVFIKIYNNIEKIENQESIKPWLYKITKNTIIDYYKKKKDLFIGPETLNLIKTENVDLDNMNDDILKCINRMIFCLPEKYSYVYDLHEKKGMKHKEIAEMLGISVNASKVRLKRAKDMFKEKLLACCDFKVDKYGNIIEYYQKGICEECTEKC